MAVDNNQVSQKLTCLSFSFSFFFFFFLVSKKNLGKGNQSPSPPTPTNPDLIYLFPTLFHPFRAGQNDLEPCVRS